MNCSCIFPCLIWHLRIHGNKLRCHVRALKKVKLPKKNRTKQYHGYQMSEKVYNGIQDLKKKKHYGPNFPPFSAQQIIQQLTWKHDVPIMGHFAQILLRTCSWTWNTQVEEFVDLNKCRIHKLQNHLLVKWEFVWLRCFYNYCTWDPLTKYFDLLQIIMSLVLRFCISCIANFGWYPSFIRIPFLKNGHTSARLL